MDTKYNVQKTHKTNIPKDEFVLNFIVAGSTAAATKTATAPFERLKLIVQSEKEILKAGRLSKPFKGVKDLVIELYLKEGFTSFWRGNTATILRYFPTQGLNFALNDKLKSLIPPFVVTTDDNYKTLKKLSHSIFVGGLAGSISQALFYTLDLSRTQLANDMVINDKNQRRYKRLTHVYSNIYKTEGLRGLNRGLTISLSKMFIYRGLYFGLFDFSKTKFQLSDKPLLLFLGGYTATLSATAIAYPLDTINKRLIMTSGVNYKYKNSLDCFYSMLRNEGVHSFYRGFSMLILKNISAAGLITIYDQIKPPSKSR